ncbi:hypothetical protein PT974_07604 [Cladobotryum mycophilum]|uniref:Heterokaryon incompatibility domain-containing protein n=1 Tax=Cladobotryum mycophilum TaxID=491253 RepID=A0ABR0SPW9_9HYPO
MPSRCEFCTSLSIEALRSRDYEHHKTLLCLKTCAQLGVCDLCTLFWACIEKSCDKNDVEDHLKKYTSDSHCSEDTRVVLRGFISNVHERHEISSGAAGSNISISVGALGQSRVYGHISVFSKPNEAASEFLRERNLNHSEDPQLRISITRKWLSDCQQLHSRCGATTPMNMPTRVIDLGPPEASIKPRLFVTNGATDHYVALSYSWGDGVRHKVTLKRATLAGYMKEIPEGDMTLAHREALQIARELHYRYIWIDALCIVQDDKDDWAQESNRIADVYGNAELTIVAGRSKNSLNGFLGQTLQPCQTPSSPSHSSLSYSRPNTIMPEGSNCYVSLQRSHRIGPVDKRAWCFQESVLSRRMVIYGEEQLIFKCRTRTDYEDGGYGVHEWDKGSRRFDPSAGPIVNQHLSQREILEEWYKLTIQYSIRNLWDPTDIFATLCGVATRFQQALGCRYLAGLWENDMIRGLLWKSRRVVAGEYNVNAMKRPHSAPTKYGTATHEITRAPSWSWTALEGHIWPAIGRQYDKRLKDSSTFRCRPANADGITWTKSSDDWNPSMVKNLPLPCRLEVIGNPRQVRRSTVPITQFPPRSKWSYSIAKLKKHMILLESAESHDNDRKDTLSDAIQPEDSVVAYGLSDLDSISDEIFWAINDAITDDLPPAEPPQVSADDVEPDEEGADLKYLVSAWHHDSYPWVCVLMLSDPVGMSGGGTALRKGDGGILKMRKVGMGYAVMIQGSLVSHAALRTLGSGERITFVVSMRPRDPLSVDTSTLRTVKPISNNDELFRQWADYQLNVVAQRVAKIRDKLREIRPAKETHEITREWVREQIDYLQTTVDEMDLEDFVAPNFNGKPVRHWAQSSTNILSIISVSDSSSAGSP